MTEYPRPFVTTQWLDAHRGEPNLVLLDCSFHMPASGRDAQQEFARGHLPGAGFFDFDGRIRDADSNLPHMLPDATLFESEVRKLGVNKDSFIVMYDVHGLFSAARGWWMFRCFGHENVAVLRGGLPQWQREGRPLEQDTRPPRPGNFRARPQPQLLRNRQQVLDVLRDPGVLILDARSADRFHARVPEPRPGLRGGHIPGSRNLPFDSLLAQDGCGLVGDAPLRDMLQNCQAPDATELIACCGSGVTACIIALACYQAGRPDVAVYDGSWAEWGADPALPVAEDPAP